MREQLKLPLPGTLLLSHLAAYGLLVALDAESVEGFLSHPRSSQSLDPFVEIEGERDLVNKAIRSTARRAEHWVEANIEPGTTRAVVWARASFAKDPAELPKEALLMRERLVRAAERARDLTSIGILSGLGATAAWGLSNKPKPSQGASELDGVIGNKDCDLVRGVLRKARIAAERFDGESLSLNNKRAGERDKTGWAPLNTEEADLVVQWLAVLGLALLPVAHRQFRASSTPACWITPAPQRRGITLPLFSDPVSLPRLRGLLSLQALAGINANAAEPSSDDELAHGARLRALGVEEVVVFDRHNHSSSGSSVAFSFTRGRLVRLR